MKLSILLIMLFQTLYLKTLKFHEIREAIQNDQILIKVCDAIINNRWRLYKNDIHLKPYYIL